MLSILAVLCIAALGCEKKVEEECVDDVCPEESESTEESDTGSDTTAPVPGTGPTFSAISSTSFTINWTAASDDKTSEAELEYQLVRGESADELTTVAAAQAVPAERIIVPWARGTLSSAVSNATVETSFYYAVLVRDAAGNVALYPSASVTTLAYGAPVPGASLTFSSVSRTGFHVTWDSATDPSNLSLSYKVVYASSTAEIDTVEEAAAVTSNTSDWLDASTNVYDVTSLVSGTPYAVTILVKNSNGNQAIYTPQLQETSPRRIFVTNASFYGHMRSSSSPDARCNSDANNPGGTFKALVSWTTRYLCTSNKCATNGASEASNWVLAPNVTYGRLDGTIIGKTGSIGMFTGTLTNSIAASGTQAWLGMDSSTYGTTFDSCSSWTWNDAGHSATILKLDTTDVSQVIASGQTVTCDNLRPLVCVEQ